MKRTATKQVTIIEYLTHLNNIGPLNRWTDKVSKCLTQMAEQLIKIFNLHGYLNDWTTLGKFCISGLSMKYIPIEF